MSHTSVIDCSLTLCEPAFFASREIDRLYLTEPLIGNYALVYALGLVQSPYYIERRQPQYEQDLILLSQQGIYITPAHPITKIKFQVERFNVQTESYWSAYTNGAILFDPAEMQKTKPKPYANNRPQQGMLKMLARGMKFRFFIFGVKPEQLPAYIRVGKFLSKASLDFAEVQGSLQPHGSYKLTGYYNPLDWPDDGKVQMCNVVNIHPVPVLQSVTYQGSVYQLAQKTYLAAGLGFRFS